MAQGITIVKKVMIALSADTQKENTQSKIDRKLFFIIGGLTNAINLNATNKLNLSFRAGLAAEARQLLLGNLD